MKTPHWTWIGIVALLLFFSPPASAAGGLRDAGRGFLTPSVSTEKDLGREFHEEAKKRFSFIKNPEVLEYVHRIGQRIVQAAGFQPYTFRFFVIVHPQINAFAVPGGYIYLHSGLIVRARSTDELAGVIAHEIAHVKERHMARQVQKGTLVNLATLAAIFLSQGNPAVAASAAAIGQSFMLKYSREFEREADRFGALYMDRAGFHPMGMVSFFHILLKEQLIYSTEVPPYLQTHPLTEERMNGLENLIQSERLGQGKASERDDFPSIKALVMAEGGRQEEVLRSYRQRVEKDPGEASGYYELGIIYRFYGWFRDSIEALQRALQLAPGDAKILLELTRLKIHMGNLDEAEALLERAETLAPHSPIVSDRKGDLLMKKGMVEEAIAAYRKALLADPYLFHIHHSLGLAHSQKGEKGEFHYRMGQYYRGMGDEERAFHHLEQALKEFGPSSPKGRLIQEEIEPLRPSRGPDSQSAVHPGGERRIVPLWNKGGP